MGQFATGVTVVTGMSDGQPVGFVAQSFVSVSLEPPLIAVCPGRQSSSWPKIRTAGAFAVNVLAADQRAVCDSFSRPGTEARDKFADIEWAPGVHGQPLLAQVLLQVECDLTAEHEAGDHWIAVGRVRTMALQRPEEPPLTFFRGRFGVQG